MVRRGKSPDYKNWLAGKGLDMFVVVVGVQPVSVANTALAAAAVTVVRLVVVHILYNGSVATMVLAEAAQVMALTHNYDQAAADDKTGEVKLGVDCCCNMLQQIRMYCALLESVVDPQDLVGTDAGSLVAAGIVCMLVLVAGRAIVGIAAEWGLVVGFERCAVNVRSLMM